MELEVIGQNEGKQVIQFIFSVDENGKTYQSESVRFYRPEDFRKIKCIKNGYDKDHDLFLCFGHSEHENDQRTYNPCIYAGKLY